MTRLQKAVSHSIQTIQEISIFTTVLKLMRHKTNSKSHKDQMAWEQRGRETCCKMLLWEILRSHEGVCQERQSAAKKEEVCVRSQVEPEWLSVTHVYSSAQPWLTDHNLAKSPELRNFASSCVHAAASSHAAWRGGWLAPLEHTCSSGFFCVGFIRALDGPSGSSTKHGGGHMTRRWLKSCLWRKAAAS